MHVTVAGHDLRAAPSDRPLVVAAMVASADGRALGRGRAAAAAPPAHARLVGELRASVDAVLIGGRTLAHEGPQLAVDRRLTVIPTRTLALRLDVPVMRDPGSRVLVVSSAPVALPLVPAAVELDRVPEATLAVPALLTHLRTRHGVRVLLCAGGPTLLGALAAAGALDLLHVTVVPVLAGAPDPPLLAGSLHAPGAVRLLEVREAEGCGMLTFAAAG